MATNKSNSNASAQFEEALRSTTKAFQDATEQMNKFTRNNFFPNMMTMSDEASSLTRETLDAAAQSSALWMKGCEQILNTMMTFSQQMTETQISATKAAMGCKNMKDLTDLQTDVLRTNADQFMTESSKISEMTMKVANEASQPLQKRFSKTVQQFAKKAA